MRLDRSSHRGGALFTPSRWKTGSRTIRRFMFQESCKPPCRRSGWRNLHRHSHCTTKPGKLAEPPDQCAKCYIHPMGSLQATLSYALTGFMHDGNPEIYWKWDDIKSTNTQTLKGHWPGFPPFASLTAQKAESTSYPYVVASIERPKNRRPRCTCKPTSG